MAKFFGPGSPDIYLLPDELFWVGIYATCPTHFRFTDVWVLPFCSLLSRDSMSDRISDIIGIIGAEDCILSREGILAVLLLVRSMQTHRFLLTVPEVVRCSRLLAFQLGFGSLEEDALGTRY